MKVLVIGSGGREHALVSTLSKSPKISRLYAAPGSDAIARLAECVSIPGEDVLRLADFAGRTKIDLTVVGPETPLTLGITDEFQKRGLRIIGPTRSAARLEGSKLFTKNLLRKLGVPSAGFEEASSIREAEEAIERMGSPLVVKADGLAAGKGVVICSSEREAREAARSILIDRQFGAAGEKIVIEKFLRGEEASFIALTDGRHVLPLAVSQDHKRVFDNDEGPNTGGMGAYSPAPIVDPMMYDRVLKEVMYPVVRGMEAEGCPFQGILYAGLMIDQGRPSVLEFNCRFGDPETQPILSRLKSDLLAAFDALADRRLHECTLEWDPRPAVCVVMAAEGYPGSVTKGDEIQGLDEASALSDTYVYHAGTRRVGEAWQTNGGRVLGVTSLGNGIEEAVSRAYDAVSRISWRGCHYRRDIARRAIGRM